MLHRKTKTQKKSLGVLINDLTANNGQGTIGQTGGGNNGRGYPLRNTTEILMCNKEYDKINFHLVPGRCLNINKRAFLNLKGKKGDEPRTNEENRIKCRENLLLHLDKAKSGKLTIQDLQGGTFTISN